MFGCYQQEYSVCGEDAGRFIGENIGIYKGVFLIKREKSERFICYKKWFYSIIAVRNYVKEEDWNSYDKMNIYDGGTYE